MRNLTSLAAIPVPDPKPDQVYAGRFFERDISFRGLKKLLGAAEDRPPAILVARKDPGQSLRNIARDLP